MIEKALIIALFTFFHLTPSYMNVLEGISFNGINVYALIVFFVAFIILRDTLKFLYPDPVVYKR